ncbi:MAG: hypothetical protein U1F68_12865 [Gammaproteobacteria bacterium]
MADEPAYVFDAAPRQATARLAILAELFDPGTIRHLKRAALARLGIVSRLAAAAAPSPPGS